MGPSGPAEEVAVQLRRAGRFRAGLGVEIHNGDDPHVRFGCQRPRVMRVPPSVKEDHLPGVRADDCTVLLHRADFRRIRVMREDKFATRSRRMIGRKEDQSTD
jgi:hypothetical protein